MNSMRCVLAAAMLAATTSAHAQAAYGQPAFVNLGPGTEVVVTPNDTLATKTARAGDKFRISTVFDVMQDGHVVIPRGTPGEGTVSYRTGKGAFGRSGKMEVEFNWLDLNGRHIPLAGTHHEEGQGNTGYAIGALVAAGLVGSALVTGHSAYLSHGQQLRARTVDTLAFDVPAPAAVSLAAMTLAPAAPRVATSIPSNGDNVVTTALPLAYP